MSAFDLLLSAALTLALHATALLGAVWLAEQSGVLRHAGWAEFAWRAALFLALVSTSVQVGRLVPDTEPAVAPATTGFATAVPTAVSDPGLMAAMPATENVQAEPTDRVRRTGESATAAAPPGTRRPVATLALPDVVARALLAAWLLAIAVGALRLGGQALGIARLARHVRRHSQPPSAELRDDSRQAAAVLDIAPPSLHLLDGLASPMLLPGRRLLLPTWVPALRVDQRRALLAHELAHLQRRDPTWRVLQRLAALPVCFHPLAWHALARLDALAEDACDARAARLAGSGRPLAECLAACLTHAHGRRAPVLAVAMADRPGPVVRRVKNLLEESPMSDRPVPPLLRRIAIVAGITLAIALPGLAVTSFAANVFADDIISHLSLDGGDTYRYRNHAAGQRLQVDMAGAVAFNDAETDVVRLGKNARFKLVEKVDGVEREVRIFGKDGVIQRAYRVDGEDVAWDAGGRAWLAKSLPSVLRESAIDADARAQRLLAKGGTPALLAEIALIQSDHARARYLGLLFANATLDDAQTAQALELAQGIESDFELRNALQAAVDMRDFAVSKLPLVLEAATTIESDFELAELLSTVAEEHALDDAVLPGWKRALATIESDFEHRRVLDALLERGQATSASATIALDSARGIDSDFELRQVLEAAAPLLRGDAGATAAWFRAEAGMESGFEKRSALQALLEAGPVDIAVADGVLTSVASIDSDFEAGEVLTALAATMPDDLALRERYRTQARRLGDHERGQAERALDRFAAN